MVKYGKEFRSFQISQWKDSYLNYKLLKREIKSIKNNIDQNIEKLFSRNQTLNGINEPMTESQSLRVANIYVQDMPYNLEIQDLNSLYNLRFGNELKRFINLLDKEFRKCYIFFVNQEKELYKRVNTHCYNSAPNKDSILINICNQIKELSITMKLAKQLSCFINDNVMALKKILKKFDKKFSTYFGIITPKYILTHLTSYNSDLEYLLQFKLIEESTTICENNLSNLLNLYKKTKINNINKNTNDNNQKDNNIIGDVNLNTIQENINIYKRRIYESIDTIDELTYFKIQYREWFYYAKQSNRIVKNNPTLLENDVYNPILSSAYSKDSILEKCISSKNAFKEVGRSHSAISRSNKINLILIYIQAFIYGTMLTNILPFITNYFGHFCNQSYDKALFMIPLISSYIGYLFPFILFIFIDFSYDDNFFIKKSYIISYVFLLISSFSLFFVKSAYKSSSTANFLLITVSRLFIGLANNQMMNKKYITLYVPKYRLPSISETYLIVEISGQIIGPLITLILFSISKREILNIEYSEYNCIGWYNFFISIIFGIIHFFFFIQPKIGEFSMVEDEKNINGNKYYQSSEKQLNRKQYVKEQNVIYKKTFNSIKKASRENSMKKENNENEYENININNINKNKKNNKIRDDYIIETTNNNLEENLIEKNEKDSNNVTSDLGNNSLDVSVGGGNIALTAKQQLMINEIDKVLDKKNMECQFNDMNQIPKIIDLIINKEKNSFGYINQNILILFIIFFMNSFLKINIILYYIFSINYISEKSNLSVCLLMLVLCFCQIFKIFFIIPFYQINYKYKTYMLISLTSLVLFNIILIILSSVEFIFIFMNIGLVVGCNIIETSCASYLSFILSPEWKFLGKNVGHWFNFIIVSGKVCGGIICLLLNLNNDNNSNANRWVLLLSSSALLIFALYFLIFTRILRVKGIIRVIRKSVFETNLG